MQSVLGRSSWQASTLRDLVRAEVTAALGDPRGQALIDRRLYLPDSWAGDAERRRRARVPEEVAFATKPRIACDLIAATLDAGIRCAWVLADAA